MNSSSNQGPKVFESGLQLAVLCHDLLDSFTGTFKSIFFGFGRIGSLKSEKAAHKEIDRYFEQRSQIINFSKDYWLMRDYLSQQGITLERLRKMYKFMNHDFRVADRIRMDESRKHAIDTFHQNQKQVQENAQSR